MKKIKILLIDDDPVFLSITKDTLKYMPFLGKINCITHVIDARQYLDLCIVNGHAFPDIIFLDIHMPGIGGLDFADLYNRRYANQYPDTRLVILSSSRLYRDKIKALEIPAVKECIQKPLTEEILNNLLQQQTAH